MRASVGLRLVEWTACFPKASPLVPDHGRRGGRRGARPGVRTAFRGRDVHRRGGHRGDVVDPGHRPRRRLDRCLRGRVLVAGALVDDRHHLVVDVLPSHLGLGLGTALAAWVEHRARTRGLAYGEQETAASDDSAAELLDGRGYERAYRTGSCGWGPTPSSSTASCRRTSRSARSRKRTRARCMRSSRMRSASGRDASGARTTTGGS